MTVDPQMRSMMLKYWPTKLGYVWGKCRWIFQHHGAPGDAEKFGKNSKHYYSTSNIFFLMESLGKSNKFDSCPVVICYILLLNMAIQFVDLAFKNCVCVCL